MRKTGNWFILIWIVTSTVNVCSGFNGGNGEIDNPYQIATPSHLLSIGSNVDLLEQHYILVADVNMADYVFDTAIIAPDSNSVSDHHQGKSFDGTFDGDGHKIMNLTINTFYDDNPADDNNDYLGLFGRLEDNSIVKNLGVVNITIIGGDKSDNIGALAGYSDEGIIINCYSTGSVKGNDKVGLLIGNNDEGDITGCYSEGIVQGIQHVGGLAGYHDIGTIIDSYSRSTVISINSYSGGLVGTNSDGILTGCYSTGSVEGMSYIGGLVGYSSEGVIYNCYSRASVTGWGMLGGLVGYIGEGGVTNSYSAGPIDWNDGDGSSVGGLVGVSYEGNVSGSFWDIEISGIADSAGGIGLVTAEMQQPLYYGVYNWGGVTWTIDEGNDYPRLEWENVPGQLITDPDVKMKGSGTEIDPWIINTEDEFFEVCSGSYYWDKSYLLNTDINLSGITYHKALIGEDSFHPFTGVFDGGRHTVKGLTIIGGSCLGLFGCLDKAKITNLNLVEVNITNSHNSVGSLAGYAKSSEIRNCYAQGVVYANAHVGGMIGINSVGEMLDCISRCTVAGDEEVGGLAGNNHYGVIKNCRSISNVTGEMKVGGLIGLNGGMVDDCSSDSYTDSSQGITNIGGLIGINYENVTNCYSSGFVTGGQGVSNIGGLIGRNDRCSIQKCYSTASVKGYDSNCGGLAGLNYYGTVTNSYSTGSVEGYRNAGGLVGNQYMGRIENCYSASYVTGDTNVSGLAGIVQNTGRVLNSFWDGDVSGAVINSGGIRKTTAEMQTKSTFTDAGWDFDNVWWINEGIDYPRLSYEHVYLQFDGGSGLVDDPYQISTPSQLASIRSNEDLLDKHYILTADIDMQYYIFLNAVIAPDVNSVSDYYQGKSFNGSFDGDGHKILNITINTFFDGNAVNDNNDYLGLFGRLGDEGVVRNLGLVNTIIVGGDESVNVGIIVGENDDGTIIDCYTSGSVKGGDNTGGLVGREEDGEIISCYSTSNVSGDKYVGGLVGLNDGGSIKYSRSIGTIQGQRRIGGITGWNRDGSILECLSKGNVFGYEEKVGGLVGFNAGDVLNCYSMASVTGEVQVGGLIGYHEPGSVKNCYSAGKVIGDYSTGGLAGEIYEGGMVGCFWDTETSGMADSAGGIGLTTSDMQQSYNYSAYNWGGNTWTINKGNDYPHLAWENAAGDFIADPDVKMKGSGTEIDPWIIESRDEFLTVCSGPYYWDKSYLLNTDIDLEDQTWHQAPIGFDSYHPFTGSIDGNGYSVSNLTIIGSYDLGLFGYVKYGSLSNLNISDVNIPDGIKYVGALAGRITDSRIINCSASGNITGYRYMGILAGNSHDCLIRKCSSGGKVTCQSEYVGGLVGSSSQDRIEYCYSDTSVDGQFMTGSLVGYIHGTNVASSFATGSVSGQNSIGGLIGLSNDQCTIESCYSTGNVTGKHSVGGLVGSNQGQLFNSYSWSNVTGIEQSVHVGGLIGSSGGNITNCYSKGLVTGSGETGGLIGSYGRGNIINSFWDIETSGMTVSAAGEGKTTIEMLDRSTYVDANWNFDTYNRIWWINDGRDYPRLYYQPFGDINNDSRVNMSDLAIMSASWMSSDSDPEFNSFCELSGDDVIDISDLYDMIDKWMTGPQFPL